MSRSTRQEKAAARRVRSEAVRSAAHQSRIAQKSIANTRREWRANKAKQFDLDSPKGLLFKLGLVFGQYMSWLLTDLTPENSPVWGTTTKWLRRFILLLLIGGPIVLYQFGFRGHSGEAWLLIGLGALMTIALLFTLSIVLSKTRRES